MNRLPPTQTKGVNKQMIVHPVKTYWSPADDMYWGNCPECDTFVSENDKRCPHCGAVLDWWGDA